MDASEFRNLIRSLEINWKKANDKDKKIQHNGIEELLETVYKTSLMLELNSQLKEDEELKEIVKLMKDGYGFLIRAFYGYSDDTMPELEANWEEYLTQELNEKWLWICKRWSAANFFRDMIGQDEFEGGVWFNPGEEYDEYYLETNGEKYSFYLEYEIPPGIPKSHWWWFYPFEHKEKKKDSE